MKLAIRKLEVTDAVALERLVIEHIDGIEPGLSIIDSRLMLGHATIDLVAQDAAGSLVLIALGWRADENMLLRVVDAYSWCLEYPEAVQRHYPMLAVSEERPPRVVFVMSRVPESFQRKIKQLSFPSVDAVEFHQLEVNGVPAVFFDSVSRIRRGAPAMAVAAVAAPDIAVRPAPVRLVPEPVRAAVEPVPVAVEPVKPASEPVRLAAELSALLGGYGSAPRVMPGADRDATATVTTLRAVTAAAVVAVEEEEVEAFAAPAIAGGSDAPAAVLAAPEVAAEEQTEEQKVLVAEAAKAAKIAQELGIQLPNEGLLTRQWIDFLNQMAGK
jgi:hypothetical protein